MNPEYLAILLFFPLAVLAVRALRNIALVQRARLEIARTNNPQMIGSLQAMTAYAQSEMRQRPQWPASSQNPSQQ